tara:strand:- start:1558 stop:2256 length:699 start_codon:yes stop_codon:yes gene_type:complete
MPKKKFKINNKSSQKYLWIVDWAKENKKSAILSIILLLFISFISKLAALLYLLGAIFFLKGAKNKTLIIGSYIALPIIIAVIINSIFAPSIENSEQARKFLSNTSWSIGTSTPNPFGEKGNLLHTTIYHFSENAESCYGEHQVDFRLNKGKSADYVAGNEHSVEIGEKTYFRNKYGGDDSEFYFAIESECIFDNGSRGATGAILSLGLANDGKLIYEKFFKGERSTFNARKK